MNTYPQLYTFGDEQPGVLYVLRPGGYSVIYRSEGPQIALVSAPGGFYLPGGGQEENETPEQAAVREAREECGLAIELNRMIGVADELVFADSEQVHYRKRCAFYIAIESGGAEGGAEAIEPDHQLHWSSPREAIERLRWESQRWAVREACDLLELTFRATPIAEDPFLEAILADPANDEPRLLFADWLDERADPRGEFIRVQVEMARPGVLPAERVDELVNRQTELLADHEHEWAGWNLAAPGVPHGYYCKWERGFALSVHEDAPAPETASLRGLAMQPLVRDVRFPYADEDDFQERALAHLTSLVHLETLVLHRTLTDKGARHLAKLVSLKELVLDCVDVSIQGMAFLDPLVNLERLHLAAHELSGAHLVHLAGLVNLRELLLLAELDDEALAFLPALPRLMRLTLDADQATFNGFRQLQRLPGNPLLELSSRHLTNEHIVHLEQQVFRGRCQARRRAGPRY